MKKNIELNNKTIFQIVISSLISSIIITLIQNTVIDDYFKYFMFPLGILLANYLYIVNYLKIIINKNSYIYLIPISLIITSNTFINIDFSNMFLNIIILPIIMSIFFFASINKDFSVSRHLINWCFKLFPSNLIKNLSYFKNLKNENKNFKKNKLINIFIGIIIGLPIAILLLNLLSSADQYFSAFIKSISNLFSYFTNFSFIFNKIFKIGFFFIIIYNIIINIFKNQNTKEKEIKLYNPNNEISKTILIIVNAVFILFLISEISKITSNFLSLPIEYTFAQYAREGFFQLLFVTIINFAIIAYYLYYIEQTNNNKFIKNLLTLLICFSILLIFNSYYRMFLYIGNYGFTVLRLQVIIFLMMELIFFLILLKKVISGLKKQENILFISILIITYLINLYFCTDSFIDLLNSLL